jgi:hypothetical protein
LPNNWYAFANLDLVLDLGRAREVDLVIITDGRIFLVDLKDWYGLIESREGKWFLDGNERGPSPVAKVTGIARDLYPILKEALQKRPETGNHPVPKIEGLRRVDRQSRSIRHCGNRKSEGSDRSGIRAKGCDRQSAAGIVRQRRGAVPARSGH